MYVFRREGVSWSLEQRLFGNVSISGSETLFGRAVALYSGGHGYANRTYRAAVCAKASSGENLR